MSVETITIQEAHRRMAAQGVGHQRHYAFRCPICDTVQSMASLVKAGADKDQVHKFIAFSCEGRFSDAGPFSTKGKRRKDVRGCDWTLGGLFKLHKLEISYDDGTTMPSFEIVGPEEAQALQAEMIEAETQQPKEDA